MNVYDYYDHRGLIMLEYLRDNWWAPGWLILIRVWLFEMTSGWASLLMLLVLLEVSRLFACPIFRRTMSRRWPLEFFKVSATDSNTSDVGFSFDCMGIFCFKAGKIHSFPLDLLLCPFLSPMLNLFLLIFKTCCSCWQWNLNRKLALKILHCLVCALR